MLELELVLERLRPGAKRRQLRDVDLAAQSPADLVLNTLYLSNLNDSFRNSTRFFLFGGLILGYA